MLPGRVPLDEVLFFLVVPVAAVLTLEAVRAGKGWRVGDEPPGRGPVTYTALAALGVVGAVALDLLVLRTRLLLRRPSGSPTLSWSSSRC